MPANAPALAPVARVSKAGTWVLIGVSLCALALSALLWWKLQDIQETLARQTADSGSVSVEARASAKQAQELARDTAARLALSETRWSEVALQRTQLEELMQSLSRSRDENLVVDIESALRLALQQAQLTGSVQPLVAALKSAQQRLSRVAQPRLSPVLRALTRDLERVQSISVTNTPALLVKFDELVRLVDELPLANAVGVAKAAPAPAPTSSWARAISVSWWEQWLKEVGTQVADLVRISRIDQPEASLLSPDQGFFVRENLKLRLLNARLGLLARQFEASRNDVLSVRRDLQRYFETSGRKPQAALAMLQEVETQLKQVELPRLDESLTALATASAGR
jgi:uroporphyrin-III C-methyltransferase